MTNNSESTSRLTTNFVIAAPAALIVPCFIWFFWRVKLPFWDQFTMSLVFDKYYSSQLTFADLWAPYNGHRILLQRVISLGLGVVTHWWVALEAIISNLINLAIFLLVLREMRGVASVARLPALLFVSVMFFSFNQYENWFNGWDLCLLLSELCTLGAFLTLNRETLRLHDVALAALLAIISSVSFGAGIATWPVGFIAILLSPATRKWRALILWSVTAVVTLFIYTAGAASETRPDLSQLLQVPVYLASYLGAPIFSINGEKAVSLGARLQLLLSLISPLLGLAGFVAVVGCYFTAYKRGVTTRAFTVPLLLCLFALFTGALIAVARTQFGRVQAMSPHYISISRLFWVGGAMLYCLAQPRFSALLTRSAGAVVGVMLLASYANGARHLREWHTTQLRAQEQLWSRYDDVTLRTICPVLSFAELHSGVEALKRNQLALYRGMSIDENVGLYLPGNAVNGGEIPR